MSTNTNFPIIDPNMNFNSSTIDAPTKVSTSTWQNAYANVIIPLTGDVNG